MLRLDVRVANNHTMAFETHVIALSWRLGRYTVVGHAIAAVNTTAIQKEGLHFNEVSGDAGYQDHAAILSKRDFEKCLLPEASYKEAADWYAALPSETTFV